MGDAKKPSKSDNKVLLEREEESYLLRIEVTPDEMEALLTLTPRQGPAAIAAEELQRLLKEAGVVHGVHAETLLTLSREANRGKPQENIVVAFGKEPEPGPDGWIEFLVRVASDQVHLEETDEGKVDLRKLNLFGNVEPDQPIARIHPPENGPSGVTVTGLPVSPLPGEALVMVPGAGVRVEEDGALFVSETTGRVVQDGSTLCVTDEYVIRGDVDFNVGSIDFRGVVEVSGDVLDDFDVTADKGVTIGGSIGACRIESAGNIVLGSMSGKGKGAVYCGGNLVARYLSDTYVECAGNVIIDNEIRNSVVKAAGFIKVERGVLSGGEAIALAGIEAKRVGNYLGIRTELTAGVYFPEADRMTFLNKRFATVREQVQRIKDALGPLTAQKNANRPISEAVKKRTEILVVRLSELTFEEESIRDELASFRFHDHPTANPKINVGEWLGEGVVINLGAATEEIRNEMAGPISIIENSQQEGLRFVSLTPLAVRAREIEAKIAQQEGEALKG